jgi:hypothetical protein
MNSYSNTTYATECDVSGNPASGTNLWKLPIYFQTVDKAGNVAQLTNYYLVLDPNGNTPVVLISQPTQNGATFGGMVRISGTAIQPIWIHDVEVAIDPAGGTNFPANPVAISLISGSTVTTAAAHPFTSGMTVYFTGTTPPAIGGVNVSPTTPYYVVSPTSTTFQVSATSGGSAVTFSSGGSGVTASTWAAATLTTQGNSVNWYYDINTNNVYPQSGMAQTVAVQVRGWNSPIPGGARGTLSGVLPTPLTMTFNTTFPHFLDLKVGPDSNPANGAGYFAQITVSRQFTVLGTVSTSKGLSKLERVESNPLTGASTIYDFSINGANPAVSSSGPYTGTTVTPPPSISAGSFPVNGTSRILITNVGSISDWSSIGGPNPASVGTVFIPTGNGAGLTGATAMGSDVSGNFIYTIAMAVDSTSLSLFQDTTGVHVFDFRATDLTAGSPQVASTTITLNEDNYYPSSTLSSSASITGSTFKIQGSATDVGSGFGTIQGLKKVVVYLDRGGQIVDFTGGASVAPVNLYAKDMNNGGTKGNVNYPPVEKTAGGFTSGQKYEILTLGNTDFTLIGASSNAVGTVFTATGAGAGSGTAVDLTLTAKYSPYIDNKNEIGVSDTNQDGFIESFLINGNNMDWWAQFDSSAVVDGSVNVHYVIFDNAGNATHYLQSAYISNHAPLISTVVLGTDLNGSGIITTSGPNETQTFNNNYLTTNFTVRNRLLSVQINTIYDPGKNGPLHYSLTNNGNQYWEGYLGAGATIVGNTITLDFALITPKIADVTGNNAHFVLTVTDSTPGGGQSASVTVGMNIQNIDSVRPTINIAPFGERYNVPIDAGNGNAYTDTGKALGTVGAYTDNVYTSGSTLYGHVEYAGGSIFADNRPNLSGQVIFRGKAYDNQRISRISTQIPGFDGGTGAGSEFTIAEWGTSSLIPVPGTGWAFSADSSSEGVSEADGHVLNWAFTWDSSLISAVAVTNLMVTFTVYDFKTAGSGATRSSLTTLQSPLLVGMSIPNGTAIKIGPANPTWTTTTNFDSGTGTVTFAASVVQSGNTSFIIANTNDTAVVGYQIAVDVVPYMTSLVNTTGQGGLGTDVLRSSTGKYSLDYDNLNNYTITVSGFNLSGATAYLSSAPISTTTGGTALTVTGTTATSATIRRNLLKSGYLTLFVGGVPTGNNLNQNGAVSGTTYFNREVNPINPVSTKWTDDRYIWMWQTTQVMPLITNQTFYYPDMVMSGAQPIFTYDNDNNGYNYRTTSDSASTQKVGMWYERMGALAQNSSGTYYIASSEDAFSGGSIGYLQVNRDVAQNATIGTGGSNTDNVYELASEDYNSRQLNRFRYPKLIVEGPDGNTKIYSAYYDANPNLNALYLFAWGSTGAGVDNLNENPTNGQIANNGWIQLPGTATTSSQYFDIVEMGGLLQSGAYNANHKLVVVYYDASTSALKLLWATGPMNPSGLLRTGATTQTERFTFTAVSATKANYSGRWFTAYDGDVPYDVWFDVSGADAKPAGATNPNSIRVNIQPAPATTNGISTAVANAIRAVAPFTTSPAPGAGATQTLYVNQNGDSIDVVATAASLPGGTATVAVSQQGALPAVSWNSTTIESGGSFCGTNLSVATDGTNVYVSYFDSSNADLKFAVVSGANLDTVQKFTIDTYLSVGTWTKIRFFNGVPYITYYSDSYNGTKKPIRIAFPTDGLGAVSPANTYSNGVENPTVSDSYSGTWEVVTIPAISVPKGGMEQFNHTQLGTYVNSLTLPVVGWLADRIEYAKLQPNN